MRLVRAGVVAQPVVDVQRADGRGAGERDGAVEQADRVAPAGEQHDDRPPVGEQPGRPDALEHVVTRAA